MSLQEEKSSVFQMRFPQKLWYLLNLRTEAILWGGTGRTILLNYKILHKYLQCDHSIFKTTNISSFVRQLNLYGFRKVTSHLQDPMCNSSNPFLHEYVHDYFQFGRPELLNKLNRRALTGKKCFKPLELYCENQHYCGTPLQKARLAFRMALKKASQDIYMQESPREVTGFECDEDAEDFGEEDEEPPYDWLPNNEVSNLPDSNSNENTQTQSLPEVPALSVEVIKDEKVLKNEECGNQDNYGEMILEEDNFITFQESQQSIQTEDQGFLNMPDLNTSYQGVELLAEFDIHHDLDQGITKRIGETSFNNDSNSLNCVLPSVNNQFEDVAMAEKVASPNCDLCGKPEDVQHFLVECGRNADKRILLGVNSLDRSAGYSSYYNTEWDQMFNEIMTSKSNSQEGASDMRELYSQISRTIDLLNS